MKKIFCIIAAMCFILVITGCNIETSTETTKSDIYKASYAAGYIVAKKDKNFSSDATTYGTGLLESAKTGTITLEQITKAVTYVQEKLDLYPEYKSEVDAALMIINMSLGTIKIETGVKNEVLCDAIDGFLAGVKAGT